MSVSNRVLRYVSSSLERQLWAAILTEVFIISLLLWQLGQQQGLALSIVVAATVFSLLTALLVARSGERRLQELARRWERFSFSGGAVHNDEAEDNDLDVASRGANVSFNSIPESENSLEQAQRIASIGPWRYKTDVQTLFWSREIFDPVGLHLAGPAQSFEDFLAVLRKEQKEVVLMLFRGLEPGKECGFNFIVEQPDGTQRRCWVEVRVERKADGEKLMIGSCQDISDGGVAAAQLHEAQEIETVAQLTRALHHLNNQLLIIGGNLDLLVEQFPEASAGRESIQGALGAALQAAELTQQLSILSRRDAVALATTNLTDELDLLPAAEIEAAEFVETSCQTLRSTNTVVLVVEDEEDVRKVVERQLGEIGYKVVCASNAADALEVLDDGFRIDLLFTDIVMDGDLDGIDLARRALEKKPDLKVLHTSGYTTASGQAGYEVKRLLTKPYHRNTLAAAVERVLNDKSDEGFIT